MGCTKMLMEKLMHARARFSNKTTICTVRYGNVMFSRGSVLPLFFQQIIEGKDLTVTDKKMTRFLMSLTSAIELVMHAINNGKNGDLFIHKAKSAYIYDLAKACLFITNSKNKIKIIGIRAGEKISETLATEKELSNSEDMGNFWRIKPVNDTSEEKYYYKGEKKNNLKPYNSSMINKEHIKSICKIILQNQEYKKFKSK
jgi:UDP-glucose 4-epimerase